jgi:hypothetical protein
LGSGSRDSWPPFAPADARGRKPLDLTILPESFAVSRLPASAPAPAWAGEGHLQSVTRTREELSVVCRMDAVPPDVASEPGWRAIRVAGTLDFSMTGVLASLAGPLADANVSIFALSTHDTDYVLVKDDALERAIAALTAAGHRFPPGTP